MYNGFVQIEPSIEQYGCLEKSTEENRVQISNRQMSGTLLADKIVSETRLKTKFRSSRIVQPGGVLRCSGVNPGGIRAANNRDGIGRRIKIIFYDGGERENNVRSLLNYTSFIQQPRVFLFLFCFS